MDGKRRLDRILEETADDELMVNTMIFDHAKRMGSYEIVTEVRNESRH